MRYFIFRFLLAIRKLVRVITTLFIGMAILGVIVAPTMAYRVAYIILFGIVPFLIRIYYDKLLYRIKPEGMELYLSV